MRKAIFLFGLFFFPLLCSAQESGGGELPEIPLPASAKGQWIAKYLSMNGFPMSIRAFAYPGKESYLIDFYKKYCHQQGALNFSNESSPKGRILGCEINNKNLYLSVLIEPEVFGKKLGRKKVRYEGKITLSATPGRFKVDVLTNFPMIFGSRVMNKIESVDGSRQTQTLIFENDTSVRSNLKYIRKKLAVDGWVEHMPDPSPPSAKSIQTSFEKTGQMMQVTMKPGKLGGKSVVMVHWLR